MLEAREYSASFGGELLAVPTEPLTDLVSRCRTALVAGRAVQAELLAELYARRHPEEASALRQAGQQEMARREPQVAAILFRASLAALRAERAPAVTSNELEADEYSYYLEEAERLQARRRVFDPLSDDELQGLSGQAKPPRAIGGAAETPPDAQRPDNPIGPGSDALDIVSLDELVDLEMADEDSDYVGVTTDHYDLFEEVDDRLVTSSSWQLRRQDDYDAGLFEDDLYEVDEAPTREELQDLVAVDGVIPRHRRARQAAVEVAAEHDLGPDGLELLAEIFERHGWASSRRAVERELALGCTPEELRCAHDLRCTWEESAEYGIAAVGYNHPFLAWPLALQIVRAFRGYPDLDEMVEFLDEALTEWKSHHATGREQYQRLEYPAFRDYVRAKVDCSLSSEFCSPMQALGDPIDDGDSTLPAGGASTRDRQLADLGVRQIRRDSVADRVGIVMWHRETLPDGYADREALSVGLNRPRRRL